MSLMMICASFKLRSLFMRSLINFQCNSCNKSQKGVYLHHNKSQKGVLYKDQISQKGVKGFTMKRKMSALQGETTRTQVAYHS